MNKIKRVLSIIFALVLCLFTVVSILDTHETQHETRFDQELILTHIENLTANGPRSIADKEENLLALDYITRTLDGYGLVQGDTTDAPAYVIQDFVAEDSDYQNWYLKNIIVHIPANSPDATGEAVMFMGHTDSVPMGNGASDDGVAVAVMMEAIHYYLEQMENGYTLSNDLVFCFVNGEEYGLYGSQAFMEEFRGFDDVVSRIRFGTNLESRGTDGTLIMFETAANNYNTVKLFADINENIFTCSIATMIYDMMPNGTDFSNFKDAYQGLNFANITGGEDYHTQNDDLESVGGSYLSQQAQVVDAIIDRLANYDLDLLHDAEESAIFFSYLNIATVVYDHTTAAVLGILLLALLLANVWLNRKNHLAKRTAKAIAAILAGLVLTAAVTQGCYYLFQLIAALAGTIDIHMIGTITYSNTAIVVGIGLVALAMTALTAYLAVKWLKVEYRDLIRGFAYIHGALGIVLTFVLADASYLFVFSGLMFLINELVVTVSKHDFHGELLATALYMPLIMPILVLATSALGLTMAYVFGLIFALAIFAVGICVAPLCRHISVRGLIRGKAVSPVEGAMHILAAAMVIFLVVSFCKPNAGVNLQGKQNLGRLPSDDALIYVKDAGGETEYRIYDLNAYSAVAKYAPEMTYTGGYYVADAPEADLEYSILSTGEGSVLTVNKVCPDALVYLSFSNIDAQSFTIDDGITSKTYDFGDAGSYSITIHADCTVTVNGGSADAAYQEVIRDYQPLIPGDYASDPERLHFNLWLTDTYTLG